MGCTHRFSNMVYFFIDHDHRNILSMESEYNNIKKYYFNEEGRRRDKRKTENPSAPASCACPVSQINGLEINVNLVNNINKKTIKV